MKASILKSRSNKEDKTRKAKERRTPEQNKARVLFKQKQNRILYKMEEELACSWAYAVVRPVSLKCTFVLRLDNLSNKVGYLRSSTSNV